MNIKLLTFVGILAFGAALRAEPLDRRQIAADAKWLMHVDLDALRDGPSAKVLVAAWLQTEPARSYRAGIREALGLDVARDLRSATLYGQELVPDRGVLMVRAAWDKPRLMAFLARQPDYAEEHRDGREVLTWTDRRDGQRQTVFAAIHGKESVLFSRNGGDLAAALAVLDGKAGSLAEAESSLARPPPDGTVLLARASGLSEAKLALKSPILLLSENFSLTAGEAANEAFVEVQLTAASAEHVSHFRDVATGLVALARLMRANDPDVLKLLDAVTISTDDRSVLARWSGQLADVLTAAGNEKLHHPTND